MRSTIIEGKWIFPLVFALAFFLAVPSVHAGKGEKEIVELLRVLELGAPISYKNLTIVPIHSRTVKGLADYVTLDEAVRKGYITITEVEGGRVPQARVVNKSRHHIFIMAGEMLTGCKQDRLVGKDILLGPKRKVILPVYCSERGRWMSVGKQFKALDTAAIPELRRMIQAEASQGEIWSNIAKQHAKVGAKAATDALREVYEHEETKKEMDSYVARLERIPQLTKDTVGVVVGIGEEVVSIDIFLNHHLFSELWPKLLRSYAMGAIQAGAETPEVTREKAKELLNKIYKATYQRRQALDLGEEITMSSREITSFALAYRGSVVHLSLFPTEGVKGSALPRIPVIE